jgi:hypothetical protein
MFKSLLKLFTRVSLLLFLMVDSLSAAHIGNAKVTRIRNWSPDYVVVWLDRQIVGPPACATVLNKVVFNGMNSEWGKQKLGMLMTAMAAGYKVNPNCTTSCLNSWDGALTVCGEVSIAK